MNKNDFFNLFEEKFDEKYWKDVLSYLNQNIKQFTRIPKEIDIKVFLNKNTGDELKAFCDRVDENEYTIVFGKQLLRKLNLYINKEYNMDSLIFQDIPYDKKETSDFLIRNYILEFILIHEFVHIVRGHNEIKLIDESFNVLGVNLLEIDADRYASQLLAGKYLSKINKYGQEEYSYLIRNLIYAQLHLFEFRSTLKPIRDLKTEMIAISMCINGFVEAKKITPSIINLSLSYIEKIRDECIFNYMLKYTLTLSEAQSLVSNIQEVEKTYNSFEKKHKLNEKWQKKLFSV